MSERVLRVGMLGCGTVGAAVVRLLESHRDDIERLAPGFAAVLQGYMTVAKLSFHRRTALEYLILAVKGEPRGGFGAGPGIA